ncbi:aldo/keto reductase [Streptomyces umbrinus]|uniref:aldo/keto reductase n=1 Tax=Streptomyces umbrinus TaxID=67370 RepID=UPI0033F369E7
MKYATLAGTGLRVSRLGLGTATFGVAPDATAAAQLIDFALDSGVNYIDTADSYGNQARFDRVGLPAAEARDSAEEIIGKALGSRRDDIVLASKVGEPIGAGPNDQGLSSVHVTRTLERTLRRLRTDHLDIYHAHHPDPQTDVEELLSTFDDLIRQGKIRSYALSTYDGWQLTEAVLTAQRAGFRRPACHQTRYSLSKRWVEQEVLPAARHFNLSTTVFSPLAGGLFAAGTPDPAYEGDARWGGPGFSEEQRALRAQMVDLATAWDLSLPELALGWLLAQEGIACAIVGPESIEQLTQLLPAAEVKLEAEQLQKIQDLLPAQPILWS